MVKKVKPGSKKCPKCGLVIKGPRTKICPKCQHVFPSKRKRSGPAAEPAAVVAAAAEPAAKPSNAITVEQIKAVAAMVKAIGGFGRLREMLGIIHDVGGLKKFKDLAEAMSVTDGGEA
jgi:uncharacterized Zn finger protein (UPF0148 family)